MLFKSPKKGLEFPANSRPVFKFVNRNELPS